MSFRLFPKTPGNDSIMWMSCLAICLPRRIKKRPIDGRSANKRMVERKLEISTRSGSEERAGCFAQFVFLVSRDGYVALPRGAMGLSSVCDCGIF